MLSSGDAVQDLGGCDQLEIAACLLKPVTRSELLEATLAALGVAGSERGPAAGHAPPPPVNLPPLAILVAEDNVMNQKLLIEMLSQQGHAVTIAADGRETLARLAEGDFDMVLMDVQMPNMDGFEAAGIIRRREQGTGKRIPIVAVTAHAMKDDRRRCIEAGMDEYVSKPIRPQALRAAIEQALRVSGKGARPEGVAPPTASKTPCGPKTVEAEPVLPCESASSEPAPRRARPLTGTRPWISSKGTGRS